MTALREIRKNAKGDNRDAIEAVTSRDIPEDATQHVKPNSTRKLYVIVLISVLLSGTGIILSLMSMAYIRQLVQKPFPTLVQMADGTSTEIEFEDPNYRSPSVVKSFVANTLYNLMSMTSYKGGEGSVSYLDPDRAKAAPIKVSVDGKNGYITQSAWLASESLEAKFADVFRIKLAEMTPPDVFTAQEEVILKFDYIKEPEQLENKDGVLTDQWRVDVVGHLKVFRIQQGEVRSIPFNKRVYVRAIDSPTIHSIENYGELAIALNASQRTGLQIIDIRDL